MWAASSNDAAKSHNGAKILSHTCNDENEQ